MHFQPIYLPEGVHSKVVVSLDNACSSICTDASTSLIAVVGRKGNLCIHVVCVYTILY